MPIGKYDKLANAYPSLYDIVKSHIGNKWRPAYATMLYKRQKLNPNQTLSKEGIDCLTLVQSRGRDNRGVAPDMSE
jgi:hypothetical protein